MSRFTRVLAGCLVIGVVVGPGDRRGLQDRQDLEVTRDLRIDRQRAAPVDTHRIEPAGEIVRRFAAAARAASS